MSANKLTVLNGAKAKLVIVKNPFQPWKDRVVKDIVAGQKLSDVVKNEYDNIGCDIYVSVNSKTIPIDDYEILGGEMITLSPIVGKGGGGKILGLVAMIAVAVVSMGVGSYLAGNGFWALSMKGATAWAFAAASATMMIGGALVNRAFMAQPTMPSSQYDNENDPTYGWSGVQTMEGQNNAIQLTYGKVQSAGQTIGKFIQIINNEEYLNWLIACGEGQLTFSNIMINDNPVSYYTGMSLETRAGENNQSVIPYFNDTYFTKPLGYQLLDGYRTERAQGNGTQGLMIKIECPNGLFYSKDDGNFDTAWVDIVAEYRVVGGAWQPWWTGYRTIKNINNAPNGLSVADNNAPNGTYTITYGYDYDNSFIVRITYPNGSVEQRWVYINNPEKIGHFNVNVNNIERKGYYENYRQQFSFSVTSYTQSYAETKRISGAKSSAIRTEYRIDNIPAGEYEVRVRVTGRSHSITSSRASTRCYWNSITSIVYDDFIYPNIGLIGVRALATDQISGTPTIKFIKERKNIWAYNPHTKQYEQKNANNPAWACYDLLHLASRLYNVITGKYEFEARGVPANSIIYDQFSEWAKFCDEKKYYVNIEITTLGEMLNVINENVACIGHGIVIRLGTRYGAVWYCKKQPVQMFGMGNIISGTFKEDFLQTSDRANCVEISYIDADNDFNKETITLYGDNYDAGAVENATQVTFNGITNYNQAYREGKYQLFCNKWQLRTVTFEANVDAIACTIGDVILVAHDVPQWCNSGRIYSVDTENGIFILPIEIEKISNNMRMMYRTVNDKLYTISVSVVNNENGWCTVRGDIANMNDLPQKGDLFDIGIAEIGSKPFVVTNITRAQDFTRSISGIEYIEQIYDENYNIPPINYSSATVNVAQNVIGLSASQIAYTDGYGVKKSRMFISWEQPSNGGTYSVLLSKDNKTFELAVSGISRNEVELDVDANTDYYVKVITTLGVNRSSGAYTGIVYRGVDSLPPNVTALDTEVIHVGTRRYFWNFEYPTPNDIAGFRMKFIQGNKPNWDKGNLVQEGLITVQPYETTTIMQGVHTIMIKAVDNAGNESANFASCVVDFGDPLEDNVLWKMNFLQNVDSYFWNAKGANHWSNENNLYWSHYKTNGVLREDGYLHAKQNSFFWQNKKYTHFEETSSAYWEQTYDDFYLETSFICPASGWFFLEYDIDGTYNISYMIDGKDNIYKSYSTKVYVKAGETVNVKLETIGGANDTVVKRLFGVIDVPDRQEHFENIKISRGGTELPIVTTNYYTTSVVIDSISVGNLEGSFELVVMSKNPCIVRFDYISNDALLTRVPIDVVADITWQGFEKELLI